MTIDQVLIISLILLTTAILVGSITKLKIRDLVFLIVLAVYFSVLSLLITSPQKYCGDAICYSKGWPHFVYYEYPAQEARFDIIKLINPYFISNILFYFSFLLFSTTLLKKLYAKR